MEELEKQWFIQHQDKVSNQWDIGTEEIMERISESSKATIDHFGKKLLLLM